MADANHNVRAGGRKITVQGDITHVRVCVAIEAVIKAAAFPTTVDFYAQVSPDGSVLGEIMMAISDGHGLARHHAQAEFLNACRSLGIRPRNPYAPFADDYTGTEAQNTCYVITLDEFARYAAGYGVTIEVGSAPEAAAGASSQSPQNTHHQSKRARQEARILAVLRELGYDPLALPVTPGKDGVKNAVWQRCQTDAGLFSNSAFQHVWQGMRDDGILDEDEPDTRL